MVFFIVSAHVVHNYLWLNIYIHIPNIYIYHTEKRKVKKEKEVIERN